MTHYGGIVSSRILVVHEDELIRCVLAALLDSEGYDVMAAATGREGLAIIRESWPPVDLVVTDFSIPQMSSAELSRECSRNCIDLQVLYISRSCSCEET